MTSSGQRIAPLTAASAEELVDLWRTGGFDESLAGEGLGSALDVEDEAAWIRQSWTRW